MSDISHRIKEIRESKKLSQVRFAKALGVTSASISYYEGGKRQPDSSFLSKVCEHFHVNLNWLLTGEGEMFQQAQTISSKPERFVRLPVLASIAAGRPIEAIEQEPEEWLELPKSLMSLPPPYYAFKVEGDSMEPFICDGDYVVLSRDWRGLKLQGKICGFRTWEGITLKRLMMQNRSKTVWLMPINHSKHEPMVYSKDTEDLSMVGILAVVIRKFS